MKRIAIFPGTFDPPTLAHVDIIRKGRKLCDRLIIALGVNSEKKSLFSVEEKMDMLRKIFPDIEVEFFQGLIVNFAKEKGADFIIRGLKSSADFDFEFQMAQANKRIGNIETLFLIADDRYSQISSTLIREIAKFKGPLHDFVPKEIESMIYQKFS